MTAKFDPVTDDVHPLLPDDGRAAYSVAEVMRMLGLSQATVFRRIRSGRLKSRQDEGRTLILKCDLAAYLETLPAWSEEAKIP